MLRFSPPVMLQGAWNGDAALSITSASTTSTSQKCAWSQRAMALRFTWAHQLMQEITGGGPSPKATSQGATQ